MPIALPPPPPAPAIFLPGTVSTGDEEFALTLSPDGRTALFTRADPKAFNAQAILVTERRGGRWTMPELAPFSGRWRDIDPCFSPDGRRLYFSSNRPAPGLAEPSASAPADFNFWMVERTGRGWGEPRMLPAPVSVQGHSDSLLSVAADGTLYFRSARPGGKGGTDIWVTRPQGGGWSDPVNLAALNSEADDGNQLVAPDQRWILFVSNRPGHYGEDPYDLYASFRRPDGTFTAPLNVERHVGYEFAPIGPSLASDGRSLFYGSRRPFKATARPLPWTTRSFHAALRGPGNGLGDIWWVDLAFLRLDELRAEAFSAAAPRGPGG